MNIFKKICLLVFSIILLNSQVQAGFFRTLARKTVVEHPVLTASATVGVAQLPAYQPTAGLISRGIEGFYRLIKCPFQTSPGILTPSQKTIDNLTKTITELTSQNASFTQALATVPSENVTKSQTITTTLINKLAGIYKYLQEFTTKQTKTIQTKGAHWWSSDIVREETIFSYPRHDSIVRNGISSLADLEYLEKLSTLKKQSLDEFNKAFSEIHDTKIVEGLKEKVREFENLFNQEADKLLKEKTKLTLKNNYKLIKDLISSIYNNPTFNKLVKVTGYMTLIACTAFMAYKIIKFILEKITRAHAPVPAALAVAIAAAPAPAPAPAPALAPVAPGAPVAKIAATGITIAGVVAIATIVIALKLAHH